MAKRKDYVVNIDMELADNFIELASELGLDCETYEGCLLDNHVIRGAEQIKLGRVKPRKFIMIKEKYLNEWSSTLELTMTDNEEIINEFEELMKSQEEEEELATV